MHEAAVTEAVQRRYSCGINTLATAAAATVVCHVESA